MKKLAILGALIIGSVSTWSLHGEPLVPQEAGAYSADLLARVRVAATIVPGAQPSGINYVKFAESHRPLADIIEGGIAEELCFRTHRVSGGLSVRFGHD